MGCYRIRPPLEGGSAHPISVLSIPVASYLIYADVFANSLLVTSSHSKVLLLWIFSSVNLVIDIVNIWLMGRDRYVNDTPCGVEKLHC